MVEEVAAVAQRLRAIGIEGVFVGGATLGILVSDPASAPPRFTEDVDIVVPVETRYQYDRLAERLRAAGYTQPLGGHPICRWVIAGNLVDVMPPLVEILGFTNSWYGAALATATDVVVNGVDVRVIDAAHLLATKLEAFFDRGMSDPLMSKDLTDIIVLVDGRPELATEIGSASQDLRAFVARGMRKLMALGLAELVSGHLPSDASSQGRAGMILGRIQHIAGLDSPGTTA